jgi:hypothetical protein
LGAIDATYQDCRNDLQEAIDESRPPHRFHPGGSADREFFRRCGRDCTGTQGIPKGATDLSQARKFSEATWLASRDLAICENTLGPGRDLATSLNKLADRQMKIKANGIFVHLGERYDPLG